MRRSRLHLFFVFVLLWGIVVGNGNQVVHAAERTGKILSYFVNGNSDYVVETYVYSKDGLVSEGTTIPDSVRWVVVSKYKNKWNELIESPRYMYNKDGETLTIDDPWKIPADARWATIYQFVIVAPNHSFDQTYLYSTDGITEQTGKSVPENAVWATLYDSHNGWGSRLVNMSFTTYERTDNIPPTGEFLINGGALGTNHEKVSLSITASDDSPSVEMRLSNDDSTWSSWEPYRSSKEWYLTTGEEQKNVYMQLRDQAGNTVKLKQQILLDKTAPIIMGATDGETYQAPVTLTWSEGTAILDGVSIQQGHIVKRNGNHLLTVTDAAGNEKKLTFVMAIPAPVVAIQINQGAIVTNKKEVTLGLTASGGSGNLKMRFSHDKETWSDWEQAGASLLKPWILTDGDGQKKVFLELQDESGDPAVFVSDDIELDTTAPIITEVADGETYHEPVTPKWNEGTAKLDGLSTESGEIVIKNGQHTLVVTDLAGNVTTVSFVLEIFAPAIEVQINQGAEYTNKTEVTLEIKASDEKGNEMMRLSNDKKTWGPWEPVQSPKTWHVDAGDGKKTVYLAWKDASGNLISASDTITLDTTAPAVTGVEEGQSYQAPVTPSWNEGTATLDGNPFQLGDSVSTNGQHTLIVTDPAGNVTSLSFELEIAAPTVAVVINQEAEYTTKTDVIVAINVSGEIGNKKMRFSHDSKSWSDWEPVQETKSWKLAEGDGLKTVYLELRDVAGNIVTASDNIILDTTAPEITGVEEGKSYQAPVTPLWNEGAAVLDGNPFQLGDTVSTNGQHTLIVTDHAGNVTSLSFELEIAAPTVAVVINQEAEYTTNRDVTLAINVSGEIGNKKMRFSHDSKSWSDWEPAQETKSWKLAEGDGLKTVYLELRDVAGNIVTASDTITLDTTAPVVTGVKNGETYQKAVTITFNEGTATLNGSPFQSGNTVSTSGSYTLLVTDKAEHVTKVEFRLNLQLPPPPPPPQTYYPVTGVQLDQSELELLLHAASVTLKADVLPSNATNKSVTWSSSDPEVAEVNQNGTVTPKAEGTAKITVTTLDGNKTATAVVVVKQDLQLKVSKNEFRLKPNASMTFKIYAVSGGKKKDITKNKDTLYEAEDELVTVTAGKVRAGKKEGSSVITIGYQGKTIEIPVTVTSVTVTSLEATHQQAVLETENELPIKITAIFSDKSKKDVTELIEWSVKDSKIASISAEGTLTAKKSGETEITATYGGKKRMIKVLVMDEKKPDEIKLNLSKVDIKVKKTAKLVLTAYYPNGFEEDITVKASWLSTNKNIATVKKGVITGKAEGTTVIVVKYGGEELEVTVNVTKK
ncbi:Ig-like domain-containing protein [Brevibacillus sp. SYSU BS000544]|uniref:Ig-like domain-containing protein n=1 Tax=Brevibacillus sp. SYSU BS000544 TaxID=3416443 RepID=UPI003CE4F5BB